MVKITWHGHACFEIKGEQVSVVTDPFKGIGLPEPKLTADIVLSSHSHFDHGATELVEGARALKEFEGETTIAGVPIKGVATFHDEAKGAKRGKNSVYVFEVDGLRFCHLGDLGHPLTSEQLEAIGEVDVLMIPVGGTYTIDAQAATREVEKIAPKIVIPMHVKLPGLSVGVAPVDGFLAGKSNVEKIDTNSLELTKADLPTSTIIKVLKYG
ncbi:MAG: MBL fold metallo-hydrolase [Candidatus Heimdallarchaeota archaeon]